MRKWFEEFKMWLYLKLNNKKISTTINILTTGYQIGFKDGKNYANSQRISLSQINSEITRELAKNLLLKNYEEYLMQKEEPPLALELIQYMENKGEIKDEIMRQYFIVSIEYLLRDKEIIRHPANHKLVKSF